MNKEDVRWCKSGQIDTHHLNFGEHIMDECKPNSDRQCDTVIDLRVQVGRIEEKAGFIHNEVKDISFKVENIDKTLVVNTSSLEQHMQQTMMLKEQQALFQEQQEKFHERLMEQEKFKIWLNAIGWTCTKICFILASTIGGIWTVLQVFDFLKPYILTIINKAN